MIGSIIYPIITIVALALMAVAVTFLIRRLRKDPGVLQITKARLRAMEVERMPKSTQELVMFLMVEEVLTKGGPDFVAFMTFPVYHMGFEEPCQLWLDQGLNMGDFKDLLREYDLDLSVLDELLGVFEEVAAKHLAREDSSK